MEMSGNETTEFDLNGAKPYIATLVVTLPFPAKQLLLKMSIFNILLLSHSGRNLVLISTKYLTNQQN